MAKNRGATPKLRAAWRQAIFKSPGFLMHLVQTRSFVRLPLTIACTIWRLGMKRRLVRGARRDQAPECTWRMFCPYIGFLPQIAHSIDISCILSILISRPHTGPCYNAVLPRDKIHRPRGETAKKQISMAQAGINPIDTVVPHLFCPLLSMLHFMGVLGNRRASAFVAFSTPVMITYTRRDFK